ncbi:unnamed protein product [Paramecium sonneborni]|uniref:Uncharacterized protein n=1 Tax=Paramecium sonneborni TaxID=65129 RepID=A0A8S1RJZ9_9CILI|nr:unnamed protein product [Paramecium sonneborni]CAD8127359.1 unnamed protein product [Paramecium sonneborni]
MHKDFIQITQIRFYYYKLFKNQISKINRLEPWLQIKKIILYYQAINVLQERFSFKNGVLDKANFIINHSDYWSTLNKLKQKSYNISESNDANIVIACINMIANPQYIKKLKGHTDRINCIVLPSVNEEIVVSSNQRLHIKIVYKQIRQQINYYLLELIKQFQL